MLKWALIFFVISLIAGLLGFTGIADVRQGKYFEIALQDSADQAEAQESVARMAREVLSNPIIEDYRVEIEG